MAKPFEDIRQRVEKSGKRPSVLLLQRGHVKMRMARANFCLNFFGCAGFDVKTPDTLEPADLVVLCSSDPEYLALAQEICPRRRRRYWSRAIRKNRSKLRAVGIKDFVYLGMNAIEVLSKWQEALA